MLLIETRTNSCSRMRDERCHGDFSLKFRERDADVTGESEMEEPRA